MKLKLNIQSIKTAEQWHNILQDFPQAHPLQSWVWGAFKSRWGWAMEPLLFEQDGTAVAAAMVLKRSIPYTPFSIWYAPKGPVLNYEDTAVRQAVLTALTERAKAAGAIALKIDPDVAHSYGSDDIVPEPVGQAFQQELEDGGWLFSNEQIQFRNTVLLDLEEGEEALLAKFKQKTRYNIRLAGRKEVVVREGTPADFGLIYQLYAETAERDHFLIRPEPYYRDIWQAFYDSGMCVPHIAEYDGEPLAAVITVAFGEISLYMYGASNGKERNRMPTYLLQWEAMKWAREKGCTVYDMWGAPDVFDDSDRMWGVWRFKKGFNGRVAHHIGAWDYPTRPWLYQMYTQALPRYVDLLRKLRG